MNMIPKKATRQLPIKIRPATDSDVPFILNSWLKCYRDNGPIAQNVPNTIYFTSHHKLLQKIIKRSTLLVAVNDTDESQIYGYACAERIEGHFVLHFVYVKQQFRKMGIGSSLLNTFEHETSSVGIFTHYTRMAEKMHLKYNMIYHPYVILVDYDMPESKDERNKTDGN